MSIRPQTNIIIGHQNINWLANKLDRVTHYLNKENPDLFIVTEHGLSQENLQNTRISNYFLVGGFCRQHHTKGGIAAFAKKGMENYIRLLKTSSPDSELLCESALYEIRGKKGPLLVLGVYRPPSANLDAALNHLSSMLNEGLSTEKPIVIVGDVNVNILQENNDNKKITDFLACYNITRHKLPATRTTSSSSTSIDWVCTNMEQNQTTTRVAPTGLSDHTAQIIAINTHIISNPKPKEKRRVFSERSVQQFKTLLRNEDWTEFLQIHDVDTAYDTFHNTIQYFLDIACPYTTSNKKRKPSKYFWDEESELLRKSFVEANEQYLRTGLLEDKVEASRRKKDYDLKLKELRKDQNAAFIDQADNKAKALWQVINQERKEKNENLNQMVLKVNDRTLRDPKEIANNFNQYFANTAERTLNENNQQQNTVCNVNILQTQVLDKLFLYPATPGEVLKIIDSLKPKPSAGIDGISSKLAKSCKEEIAAPLTTIINKSFQQGIFPSKLKTAKVYPKLKNGPTTETSSYRPISLLPTFSKIIEKIALNRLLLHLEHNNLLTKYQHGFLKGRSTTTALIQLIENLIDKLEEGHMVTSLYLDFSKAFDCLNHDCLLGKLNALGITGTALAWFDSYLKNRQQMVEVTCLSNNTLKKAQSTLSPVQRGVPQGSVLGPVLFILLTNDLPDKLKDICQTIMFADDTVITVAEKSNEQLDINAYIAFNMTKQYCYSNDLVLNEKKTLQIIYNIRKREIEAGLPELKKEESTKYLGIVIDENLTWQNHIDQLCKKLSSGTYVIRRTKQTSGSNTAKIAYFALFESHLRYGLAVWGGTASSNLERVLVQQKRAIRCLAGLNYLDTCRESFKEMKILTVVALYIREVILHVVRTNQNRHIDFHEHNTRNATDFALPTHHLSFYEKKPSYKGALFFNNMPGHLKKTTGQQLSRQLTTWLEDRPFYSVKEFLEGALD